MSTFALPRYRFTLITFKPFAVEGAGAPAAKGIASGAGQNDPDPDWQPI